MSEKKKTTYEDAEERPLKETKRTPRQRMFYMAATLAWAACGGALFSYFQMPLAWMIGAMVFTMVLAIFGVRLQGPGKGRAYMITVLGVMLGSAFTPDVLDHAMRWGISLAAVVIFVILMTAMLSFALQRVFGLKRAEALLSASPGGFGEMVLIAESYNADVKTVSMIHATRVMFTVLLIPIYFRLFEGYVPPEVSPMGNVAGLSLEDAIVLLATAVIGYWGGKQLKLPAAALMGPMFLSIAIHLTGWTQAKPPVELVNLAQIVLGTGVGCRFVGIERKELINPVGIGIICAAVTLACALGAASILEYLTNLDQLVLWIAFAPGGLPEMTLISLAMHIDTAFVATHHLARILFIVIVISLASRILLGKPVNEEE